jgi:hypothetical protein
MIIESSLSIFFLILCAHVSFLFLFLLTFLHFFFFFFFFLVFFVDAVWRFAQEKIGPRKRILASPRHRCLPPQKPRRTLQAPEPPSPSIMAVLRGLRVVLAAGIIGVIAFVCVVAAGFAPWQSYRNGPEVCEKRAKGRGGTGKRRKGRGRKRFEDRKGGRTRGRCQKAGRKEGTRASGQEGRKRGRQKGEEPVVAKKEQQASERGGVSWPGGRSICS